MFAEYKRGTEEYQEMNFKTQNEIITRISDLADFYSTAKNKILSEMGDLEIKVSQWKLNLYLTRLLFGVLVHPTEFPFKSLRVSDNKRLYLVNRR